MRPRGPALAASIARRSVVLAASLAWKAAAREFLRVLLLEAGAITVLEADGIKQSRVPFPGSFLDE